MCRRKSPAIGYALLVASPALAASDMPTSDTTLAPPTEQDSAIGKDTGMKHADSMALPSLRPGRSANSAQSADTDVYALGGMKARSGLDEDLGSVSNIIVRADGKVRAVVVDSDEGGIFSDARKVAVDWSKVTLVPDHDRLTVHLSRKELQDAAPYESGKRVKIAGASQDVSYRASDVNGAGSSDKD